MSVHDMTRQQTLPPFLGLYEKTWMEPNLKSYDPWTVLLIREREKISSANRLANISSLFYKQGAQPQ